MWSGQTVLITGGTGSLGKTLVRHILPHKPKRLIVYSRDELKQSEMQRLWPDDNTGPMRYFVGDVRDISRLRRAFEGIDIVIHAAAMKQVPACEYNPLEAKLTNIDGICNVIQAALDTGVGQVLAISSDKACHPTNLYGATKKVMEHLIVQANAYVGQRRTRFAVCRYGNVMGSRGSVVPVFLQQKTSGILTITDERMTRFWLTLEQAVRLIERALGLMHGGEIFVPQVPSMRIVDLATAIAPECGLRFIGIRPGEKLHETLITEDEARHTMDCGNLFLIQPEQPWWTSPLAAGVPVAGGFSYRSDNNTQWLYAADIQNWLADKPEAVGI